MMTHNIFLPQINLCYSLKFHFQEHMCPSSDIFLNKLMSMSVVLSIYKPITLRKNRYKAGIAPVLFFEGN